MGSRGSFRLANHSLGMRRTGTPTPSSLYIRLLAKNRHSTHLAFTRIDSAVALSGISSILRKSSGGAGPVPLLLHSQEVAEKVVNHAQRLPQALKRGHILNDLVARVELVPFPRRFELDFFRSLLVQGTSLARDYQAA